MILNNPNYIRENRSKKEISGQKKEKSQKRDLPRKKLYKIALKRQPLRKNAVFAFKHVFSICNPFKRINLFEVPSFQLKRNLKAPFERVCFNAFERNHLLSVKVDFLALFY